MFWLALRQTIADRKRMTNNFIIAAFSLSLLGALSACETVPDAAPEMEQAGFEQVMARAASNPSPAAIDRDLTALLARTELSDDQKAKVYRLRGEKRWRGGFNKPGAVEDFDSFLALRPADQEVANVRTERRSAQSEISNHQQRLRGLQTLPAWFDDKVAMGEIAEAAARYRKSGLTPTDRQVYTLREAGYICTNASGGEAIHRYGALPAYAASLAWCPGAIV